MLFLWFVLVIKRKAIKVRKSIFKQLELPWKLKVKGKKYFRIIFGYSLELNFRLEKRRSSKRIKILLHIKRFREKLSLSSQLNFNDVHNLIFVKNIFPNPPRDDNNNMLKRCQIKENKQKRASLGAFWGGKTTRNTK